MDAQRLEDSAEKLLAVAKAQGAGQAEVITTNSRTRATRFACNDITQHQDQRSSNLRLRVIVGQTQGVATGNVYDEDGLKGLVDAAMTSAKVTGEDPKLLPLIESQPEYQNVESWDEATAGVSATAMADAVGGALALAKEQELEAAGLLTASSGSCAYLASTGVRARHRSTSAKFTISAFAEGGEVEGMADSSCLRLADIDVGAAAIRAAEKAKAACGAAAIAPGAYDVVLEPGAVSDLILFLTWLGFNSLAHAEKRSGLAGKMGEKLFVDALNISADPYDAHHQGRPFDLEGYPTQALTLVKSGVPTDLPHDRRTAALMQEANTGHGNPQPDAKGPVPANVVVAAGETSREQLIAEMKHGLLITQSHYTNAVDPMNLSCTGLTRGGVWEVRDGEILRAVKNLRFTDSLLRAFNSIEAIGSDTTHCGGGLFGGGMILPSMRIKDFIFTSSATQDSSE